MKVASARGWTPVPRHRKFTGRNRYRPVPANVPRFPGSRRIRDEPFRRIRSRCVIQNLSKRSRARAGRTQRDHGARCDPYPPAYSSKSPLRLRRPATQFCESSRGVFNIHWQVSAPSFLYRRHPAGAFALASASACRRRSHLVVAMVPVFSIRELARRRPGASTRGPNTGAVMPFVPPASCRLFRRSPQRLLQSLLVGLRS